MRLSPSEWRGIERVTPNGKPLSPNVTACEQQTEQWFLSVTLAARGNTPTAPSKMNINQIIHLGRVLENAQAVSEAFGELSEACTPEQWQLLYTSNLAALLSACDELNDTLAEDE